MPEEEDETPEEAAQRAKGPVTMFTEGSAIAAARAERDRDREIARDKEQDAEKKELVQTALGAITARAEAAEAGNKTKDALNASLHKRYGAIIFFLVIAVVGLAGKTISGNFLKGEINISAADDQADVPSRAKAKAKAKAKKE